MSRASEDPTMLTHTPAPSSRLVEYFLIYSSNPSDGTSIGSTSANADSSNHHVAATTNDDQSSILEVDYKLDMTFRYPMTDHFDNPLNEESIVPFVGAQCQGSPTSSHVVYSQDEFQLPKVHHFICTGQKGQYLYGTVLTIFEPVAVGKESEGDVPVYVPKCIVLVSQYGYLLEFREFLASLYRISTMKTEIPIERYVSNFCSEISRPEPGAFSVQYTPGAFPTPLLFTSPPHNLPLTLCPRSEMLTSKDPILTLFRVLSCENVVEVWTALVLERQVLFVSSSTSLLTYVCEALLSFLYPMSWSHVYIPLLPQIATTILSAPVPYCIGVHRDVLPSALMDMSQECIIVDIDYDTITIGPSTPTPPLFPQTRKMKLFNELHETLESINIQSIHYDKEESSEASRTKNVAKYDEAYGPPDDESPSNASGQTPVERISEAFLRFYASLLMNYRAYLIFPNKHTPDYMGFKTRQFILSQKFDFQPFLRQLCGTQQFDTFITKRLYTPSALDVVFFDECLKNKQSAKRSARRFALFKNKSQGPSWIRVREEMREKRTVVGLDPSEANLGGKTFSYSNFPSVLNADLFGEVRGVIRQSSSSMNLRSEALSKKHVAVELQKANKSNSTVATFTLFFMAFCSIIGEKKNVSPVSFKDVSPEKGGGKDQKESKLERLEEESEPPPKEMKRDFQRPQQDAPLTPVRKHRAEELRAEARAQLGLAFHILRYLRYELKHKADALTYQCLMNACGKIGETSMGSSLMTLMHEDGCVVETDMYQTLVSAFSAKNVLGRGDQAIVLPEWANGTSKELDFNKLRRKRYIEMALNYATKGHATLVSVTADENKSNAGDDQTVSDLDESSVSGSPVKRPSVISRLRSGRNIHHNVDSVPRDFGLTLTTSPSAHEDERSLPDLPEAIMVQVILGENLLETLYPDITIDTDNETCPQCKSHIPDTNIIDGWSCDENDYTTKCFHCGHKFVARFSVTSTSSTFVGSRGPTSPLYCEYLNPWTLQKELARIIEDADGGVSAFLDPKWRNAPERATVWWNMVVAFMRHRLPISFLLQGDFSSNLLIAPTP